MRASSLNCKAASLYDRRPVRFTGKLRRRVVQLVHKDVKGRTNAKSTATKV